MDSLFALYLKERTNKEIIETEKGFATYYYLPDGCYIEDIFVKKEFRRSGEASKMTDQIAKIAKEKGFNKLYGTVVPTAKGSNDSLKALQAYGFEIYNSDQTFIWLKKGI